MFLFTTLLDTDILIDDFATVRAKPYWGVFVAMIAVKTSVALPCHHVLLSAKTTNNSSTTPSFSRGAYLHQTGT